MKTGHIVLLIAAAAVAGYLALRLSELPPAPRSAAHAPEPAVEKPMVRAPAHWKTALEPPPEDVATAPPAVYAPEPKSAPVTKQKPAPAPAPYEEPVRPARHATLEAGLTFVVRFIGGNAILDHPVVAEGLEVAERGARVVVRAEEGNQLRMVSFQSADGQRVEVATDPESASAGDVIRFRLSARITVTERRL